MERFRYDQFCPLARATEILGHRWVMLILRELFVGPQRFSDLRRRLPGLSSSVLADRLLGLERQGVVERREIAPPTAATVYELTTDGRALEPALIALSRWGARFLDPAKSDEHAEPDWMGLAIAAFARSDATPAHRFELLPFSENGEAVLRVAGGPEGTHVIRDELPVDASIRAPVKVVMALMSGLLSLEEVLATEGVRAEGDVESLADLPRLFEMELRTRETNHPHNQPKGTSP